MRRGLNSSLSLLWNSPAFQPTIRATNPVREWTLDDKGQWSERELTADEVREAERVATGATK